MPLDTDPTSTTIHTELTVPQPHIIHSCMTCVTCKKVCYQKRACSGIETRDGREKTAKGNYWECAKCFNIQQPEVSLKDKDDITKKSEQNLGSTLKRPLRILQWNAEGINTKINELKCFFEEYKIDIVLIQVSKLTSKSNSPVIKGYSLVRGYRKDAQFPGGAS